MVCKNHIFFLYYFVCTMFMLGLKKYKYADIILEQPLKTFINLFPSLLIEMKELRHLPEPHPSLARTQETVHHVSLI